MDPFLPVDDGAERVGSVHAPGYGRVDDSYATQPLELELLENGRWIQKPPTSYAQRSETERRWHHAQLDAYLHPNAPRSDLKEPLLSTSPTVATNAAIVSAHWGTAAPIEHLTAAIRAERLPMPLRCAAAEALGFVQEPSPAPELRKLLAEFTAQPADTDEQKPDVDKYVDLHADLIRALARHAEPGDEAWFNAALASPAWQVRLEGAAAWSELADLSLPAEVVELRGDPDPRVRAAMIRTIAAHREPRAVGYFQQALNDPDFDVRMAAMTALGNFGTDDAKAVLAGMKDRLDEIRESAEAMKDSATGFRDELRAAGDDAQVKLRLAVSETLDEAERRGQQLAAETTASTQDAVRQATAQFMVAADAATQRVDEMQRLVAALREQDLPAAAKRKAALALQRMATDADAAVRIQAAQAMGQLADPVYLPHLMALLSDDDAVRVAAMASLVAIAGTDVAAAQAGGQPLSTDDQVRMWQLWYRERQNTR